MLSYLTPQNMLYVSHSLLNYLSSIFRNIVSNLITFLFSSRIDRVSVVSQTVKSKVNQVTDWYDVEYGVEDITNEMIQVIRFVDIILSFVLSFMIYYYSFL